MQSARDRKLREEQGRYPKPGSERRGQPDGQSYRGFFRRCVVALSTCCVHEAYCIQGCTETYIYFVCKGQHCSAGRTAVLAHHRGLDYSLCSINTTVLLSGSFLFEHSNPLQRYTARFSSRFHDLARVLPNPTCSSLSGIGQSDAVLLPPQSGASRCHRRRFVARRRETRSAPSRKPCSQLLGRSAKAASL